MSKKKYEYIMYDKESDLPVFIGTIEECAEYAGYTLSSFKTTLSRNKENLKYSVYSMNELLKDENDE